MLSCSSTFVGVSGTGLGSRKAEQSWIVIDILARTVQVRGRSGSRMFQAGEAEEYRGKDVCVGSKVKKREKLELVH